ncbi:hypothetical protein CP02DC14_2154 [Chlamydia psittaci 02DC14]|nr:hypothetical protein CP02DC14_2154 [Chlamydia psittaci 02DC14]
MLWVLSNCLVAFFILKENNSALYSATNSLSSFSDLDSNCLYSITIYLL